MFTYVYDKVRLDKHNYYLQIALNVARRGTCIRRNYGAILVKNDEIIATGYSGPPRGQPHCNAAGCQRELLGCKPGERYELCRSVHAEQNAIISAARRDMINSTMYVIGIGPGDEVLSDMPCLLCKKMILNAGIAQVVTVEERQRPAFDWKI